MQWRNSRHGLQKGIGQASQLGVLILIIASRKWGDISVEGCLFSFLNLMVSHEPGRPWCAWRLGSGWTGTTAVHRRSLSTRGPFCHSCSCHRTSVVPCSGTCVSFCYVFMPRFPQSPILNQSPHTFTSLCSGSHFFGQNGLMMAGSETFFSFSR